MDILIWYYTNKSDRGHIVKILSISLLIKKKECGCHEKNDKKIIWDFNLINASNISTCRMVGQRIVNGAANTVQTNISGKVNKMVDDVMDGKIQTNKGKKGNSNVSNNNSAIPISDENSSTGIPNGSVPQSLTYRGERGKALPFTGRYEYIDLGITKFTGEQIFSKRLYIGTPKVEIDEYLNPGYYVIWIASESRTEPMNAMYEHEREGITFGYGIIPKQKIFNNGNYDMLGNKEGIMYVVEVLQKTQGHLELSLVNNTRLTGMGALVVFKIPGPTLK